MTYPSRAQSISWGGGYEILFRKLNVILGFVWDCEARHEWRQHNVVAKTREHFTFEDNRYSTLSGETRLGMYLAKQLTELIETSSTRLGEHKAMHNVRDTFTVLLVLQEAQATPILHAKRVWERYETHGSHIINLQLIISFSSWFKSFVPTLSYTLFGNL